MAGDERGGEGKLVTFGRFEDAVKRYAAGVIGSYRMPHRGPPLWGTWSGCGTARPAPVW